MVDAGGESEQNEAEIALLSRHKEGYSATLDHVVDLLHVDFVLNVALMAHTEFQQVSSMKCLCVGKLVFLFASFVRVVGV